jgi:secreted trypsin-like serine protease
MLSRLNGCLVCTALTVIGLVGTGATTAAANDSRIIGGSPITVDHAPSIVAIGRKALLNSTGSFFSAQFCGGTLIADLWVLTAAHCVETDGVAEQPEDLFLLVNTFDLNNAVGDALDISDIFIHEDYSDINNPVNDVALLRLSVPTDAPVAQLLTRPLELDELVFAAGWGAKQHTELDGSFDFPSLLQGAEVQALTQPICNQLPAYEGRIDESMVCAGFPDGKIDSCQGDSGGPLYLQDTDGSLKLAGVTSWGDGCALPGAPGVYADVGYFLDWIETNTERFMGALQGPAPQPEPVMVPIAPAPEPTPAPQDPSPTDPNDVPVVIATNDQTSAPTDAPEVSSNRSWGGAASAFLLFGLLGSLLARRRSGCTVFYN